MPVDSTNYGRELRNIFAEIKSLRAEVANMQSALLSVQEQYGYAVVEILNRSAKFENEIAEIKSQLQNSAEVTNKNLSALEELLRLIAANQMLDEVENNFCYTKNPDETISAIQKFDENNFRDTKSQTERVSVIQKVEPITSEEMYQRGMDYFDGRNGYSKNKTYAFEYFLKAAEIGHIKAMEKVADCYKYGWGVVQDDYQARRWQEKYFDFA